MWKMWIDEGRKTFPSKVIVLQTGLMQHYFVIEISFSTGTNRKQQPKDTRRKPLELRVLTYCESQKDPVSLQALNV